MENVVALYTATALAYMFPISAILQNFVCNSIAALMSPNRKSNNGK